MKTIRWVDCLSFRKLLTYVIALCSPLALAVDLADAPLYSTVQVPGNLVLALSVEYPTASTPAYASTTYSSGNTYIGYFDSEKCYLYSYNSTSPASSYFYPKGAASSHICASAWSGNYLNWVSMQTLDTFRWVLTGGYRSVDTTDKTIVTKTYNSVNSLNPDKTLSVSGNTDAILKGATPLADEGWGVTNNKKWGSSNVITKIQALTTKMCFTNSTSPSTTVNYDPTLQLSNGKQYCVWINVQVCDGVHNEANCVQYGSSYKPEGLLQQYSSKLRYSVFGYLNDSSYGSNGLGERDGGVLRARMKYIAPTQPVPGSSAITNSAAEWSGSTGIMSVNPDSADATSTTNASKINISNSGVLNYVNKFGNTALGYKSKDPVSELYYAALRYLKNRGNVSAYSNLSSGDCSGNPSKCLDGFPAITSWTDPIAYTCQQNFILGIGDVNTHRDANLPGSSLTTHEPTMPAEVTADKASAMTNADPGTDVTNASNMVAMLEGQSGWGSSYYGGASSYGTYYIAGLAYDAHTRDIRPDLSGTQTVNTYWVDVLENATYKNKNQYWLAAKYGGFSVPSGFAPYSSSNGSTTIPNISWNTTGDKITSTVYPGISISGSDLRPDNYFLGGDAATMRNGLIKAFDKIASEASAANSTTIAPASPRQTSSGNANYSVKYNPNSWTSDLYAQLISYDTSGNPTAVTVWDATNLLEARSSSNRIIVTCCNAVSPYGLPFEDANLSGTVIARTNYASFAAVPNAATQSQSGYLAYLRGDRTKEKKNGGSYRDRTYLMGDVVDSKILAVGAPGEVYYEAYNPGYSAFKATYNNRATIIYVGANDGMLHAFDGTTPSSTSATCSSTLSGSSCGREILAYIPSFVYGDNNTDAAAYGLASLGNPTSFSHHYFVNSTPVSKDLDFYNTNSPSATTNDWHTLLVGGLGKGGKGYYALDITDPSKWSDEASAAKSVLWEFTDSHMGYSYGQANIVKTSQYGWTVVLPSGINNDDGNGYIYLVNPRTGALLKRILVSDGVAITNVEVFTPSYRSYLADAIYAVDLQGNVWRVDLTGTVSQDNDSGAVTTSYNYSVTNVASFKDSNGLAQPITTKPMIETDMATNKRYILVGTGKLLADSDESTTGQQSFYAIIDGLGSFGKFYSSSAGSSSVGNTTVSNSGVALPTGISLPVTRSQLAQVSDLTQGVASSVSGKDGWFFDLPVDSASGIASRVNTQPVQQDSTVAFAANLPNGNVCSPAGTSYVYQLALSSGQSTLLDKNKNIITSMHLSTSVVDLAIVNVNGQQRLNVGDTSGGIQVAPSSLTNANGGAFKVLNWREVPAVD